MSVEAEKEPTSELWQDLSEAASPRAVEKELSRIEQELSQPEMQTMARFRAIIQGLEGERTELMNNNGSLSGAEYWARMDEINGKIERIKLEEQQKFGATDITKRYDELQNEKYWTEKMGKLCLGKEASKDIIKRVLSDATNHDADERVRILRADTEDRITSLIRGAKSIHLEVGSATHDESMAVPVGMFAAASNFVSWAQGRPDDWLKGGRPSRDVISEYANMPKESAPPVEVSSMFVLPDGRVFVLSRNAHRVAAAIQRGDSHIELQGSVDMYVLDQVPDVFADD